MSSDKNRLYGLQSLRGIAAFAVLLQHVTFYVCSTKQVDYHKFLPLDLGGIGVEIFFTISGFVMAGCMSQGKAFMWNRALRIYPGFWLAILASLCLVGWWFPIWQFDWFSMTLLPTTSLNNGYMIPYWTLVYEMAFYAVTYAIVLVGARHATAVCLLWLLVIVVSWQFVDVPVAAPGVLVLFSKMDIFFIVGMLAALNREALPTVSMRWLEIRPLVWFGDMSFGVYLVHVPIAILTIHLMTAARPDIGLAQLWLATFAAAATGATLFGAVEHRLYLALKKATRVRRPAAVSEPVARG